MNEEDIVCVEYVGFCETYPKYLNAIMLYGYCILWVREKKDE